MTEKRVRTPLSKVRIPYFEREYTPIKTVRARVRFKTVDDVVFEVSDASIIPSTYMNRLIYGTRVNRQQSDDVTHPLPNVASDVFEKVMRYCYFHTSKYCDGLLPNLVKEWDDQFMDLDPRQLCELASAAYYLDVKDLIELTCRAIAAIISGKTAEQIRKTFHIENDLAGTIDRVLPTSVRRKGRELSPKESSRNKDINGNESQEQNPNDTEEQNPGAQKTIDELTEWINSSSSKSKKKKKKRHKDKHPAKKDECPENEDELRNNEAGQAASSEGHIPMNAAEPEEPLFEAQEATNAADDAYHDHADVGDAELLNESKPTSSERKQKDPIGHGPPYRVNPFDDNGSSQSDIAFVSEKIVSHTPVTEGGRSNQRTEALNATFKINSGTPSQPITCSEPPKADQDAAANSASDDDSVQWVQLDTSSLPREVKQETSTAQSSSDPEESSESDAGNTPHQNGPARAEDEEENGPSQMTNEAGGSDPVSERPVKEDVTMTDVRDNQGSFPALSDERAAEEPFIDCPENMDREVEAFQMRLSITEPLTSSHNTPRARDTVPPMRERGKAIMLPTANTNFSNRANGSMTEGPETPQGKGRPGSSNERPATPICREEQAETRNVNGQSSSANDASIPKEVLSQLLSIHGKRREFEKQAAEIDEEAAKLGARREKVRDNLAFLNVQEMQIRQKYNLSDPFA